MSHPQKLGKYLITGVLGEGAMGVVYKGFDPGIERAVAIKTVRRQVLDDADFGGSMAQRFRNEAQAAGRLSHPGIVAVYDYGDEGDVAYIAMEYVQGNTLQRFVANKVHFAEDDVVSVVVQLLDALGHAHAHGVWHRDIKPANLLMTPDGHLKVADFGIARIETARLTQVRTVIGTPSYMAPEQIRGLEVDKRADIYSAGVVLYLLLVGHPPFVGSTESLVYRVVHEDPVLPSVVPGCERSAAFDEVLAMALAKDPQARYDNAAAFKQALLDAVGRPARAKVSETTIVQLASRVDAGLAAGTGSHARRTLGTAGTPTGWDASLLAKVESTLARQVGPLAAVLVRRTARDCHDLAQLIERLAQHVADPAARAEFLQSAVQQRTQAGGGSHATGATGAIGAIGATGGADASQRTLVTSGNPRSGRQALSDSLLAQCTRSLAVHVGPIASVVVKRAAARAVGREAFFDALLQSVPDEAARALLRAELLRLS